MEGRENVETPDIHPPDRRREWERHGRGRQDCRRTAGHTGYTGINDAWMIDQDNANRHFDPTTGADDFRDFGTS